MALVNMICPVSKMWSVSKDSHLVSSPFNVKHVFSKRTEEACDQLCLHCQISVLGDSVEGKKHVKKPKDKYTESFRATYPSSYPK